MGTTINPHTNNIVIVNSNNDNIINVIEQPPNKISISPLNDTKVSISENPTNITVQEASSQANTTIEKEIITITQQPNINSVIIDESPLPNVISVLTPGPQGPPGDDTFIDTVYNRPPTTRALDINQNEITNVTNISASGDLIVNNITASGNISASKTITAATGSMGGLTVGKATEPGVLTIEKLGKIEFKTALINFFQTLGFTTPEGTPFRQPFISASGNGLGLFSPDEGTFHTYGKSGNNIEAGGTLEDPNTTLQVRVTSVVIGVPYTGTDNAAQQFKVEEAKVTVGQTGNFGADLIVHGGITGSFISSSQDIRAGQTSAHGLILNSPGGLKYRLKVSDLGVLSTEVVP